MHESVSNRDKYTYIHKDKCIETNIHTYINAELSMELYICMHRCIRISTTREEEEEEVEEREGGEVEMSWTTLRTFAKPCSPPTDMSNAAK